MGKIDNDGFLYIIGRNKNVIVLDNGQKIYPEEIEEKINSIKGVKESIIYASGNKINATIVYENEIEPVKEGISLLNKELPDYKKLNEILYSIDNLQKNKSQKIVRPQNETDDLDSKVKHIICKVLKRENVSEEDKLIDDLRADSLDLISINLKLEKAFDIKISREESKSLITVKNIIDYVKENENN